ncbi:hypothetical protein INR49_024598 [Caranx melampygus]|nr:hypothetical protein INR49_024598 [Caranx melampygus]
MDVITPLRKAIPEIHPLTALAILLVGPIPSPELMLATSELLLEREEEELELWQEQTSKVHLKDDGDIGELTICLCAP